MSSTSDSTPDPKRDLENALRTLDAMLIQERGPHRSALSFAATTLRTAQSAIEERDQQLELVTAPEMAKARELQNAREELVLLKRRVKELEARVKESEAQLEVERASQREERKRLADLEARAKSYEGLLQNNVDAFDQFMDRALDPKKPKPR